MPDAPHEQSIYVVSEVRPRAVRLADDDELLSVPDTDKQGRVLFRQEVPPDKVQRGVFACVQAARGALAQIAALDDKYYIDTVKLKLGIDAEVGCVFVADASVQASIEICLKRVSDSSVTR